MQTGVRDFISIAQENNKVMRISGATEIMDVPRLMREAELQGKILIVERPIGFDNAIIYNVLGGQDLMSLAFGCEKEEVIRRFISGNDNLIEPRLVEKEAPVQEVVLLGDSADVSKLPLIVHSKKDGGRYISAGVVVAKDPVSGIRNLSFNRMQLKGPRKLGIRMMPSNHLGMIQQKAEEMGKPLEVAIVLGSHPFELIAAASSPRYEVDEYCLASGLRGHPLELVKCKTVDIEVPINAEIIIEGEVLPKVREPEGPFGDFMGYYVPVMDNHIFHVKAITMRKDAIYHVMKAGSIEDSQLLGISREAGILKAVEATGAQVRALTLSPMIFNLAISIKKRFEGEAKNIIMAAFGAYPWLKFCIVVDHDVDVFDKNDVWWAMGTRCRPETGTVLISNAFGLGRDPHKLHQSKLGLDSTIPLEAWDEFERITIPLLEDNITYPI
jgi:2,5-furandicarboxylate decarboxylase 1